ncbi:MAG: DNA-directed RNA polymerase [Candidatus Diapherotrites archaeon]|nr:DNA-directed RNA polymerase [Candidatus Diapherotrites archaeon]
MFEVVRVKDKLRVPPVKLGVKMKKALLELAQEQYEGIIDEDIGVIVAVINAKKSGEGKIVHGDGAVYYDTELEFLAFRPVMHEIVEGVVNETADFGLFVRIGPIEGLVHVSQIIDEYLNYDSKNSVFVSKESKLKIGINDKVLARIVSISLKGSISDSKIGLTMRQPFLGKQQWVEQQIKDARSGKTKEKKDKDKPQKKPIKVSEDKDKKQKEKGGK